MTESRRAVALGQVAIALLCFTTGGIVARGIDGSPLAATGIRLLMAGPLLLAVAHGGSAERSSASLAWRPLIWPGLAFGIASVASQASFQWTSLANATLIPAAAPVVLLVAEYATGRRRWSARDLSTAVAVGVGLGLFVVTGADIGNQGWTGDLAAVLFLCSWTTYLFVVRGHRMEGSDPRQLTGTVMCIAAVPVLVSAAGTGGLITLTGEDLLRCVVIALLSTMIGQTLVSSALGTVEASTVGLVLLLQPILSAAAATVLFSEGIGGPLRLFSAALVLALLAASLLIRRQEHVP